MEVVCNLGLSYLGLQYILVYHLIVYYGDSCEQQSLTVLSFCVRYLVYIYAALPPLDVCRL